MVQKSMSGTAAFVHVLKGCVRADSISKLMNTKWITYVFAMKSLTLDAVCPVETAACIFHLHKQKRSRIILISCQTHCIFPL